MENKREILALTCLPAGRQQRHPTLLGVDTANGRKDSERENKRELQKKKIPLR
jgi:hypothetical protein